MYKLDKINQLILFELDKNARISDSQLAKIVGRSREAVRLRIEKLQTDGIIQEFSTSINPAKIGYLFFKLYFQLRNDSIERERLYDYLKSFDGIFWFGTSDGTWDLHTTVFARSVEDFNGLKNKLYSEFKDLILKKDAGVLVQTKQYLKNYLLSDTLDEREFYFAGSQQQYVIDSLDIKLLNVLVRDARISLINLAKKLNSTVDIVRLRLKKLQEKEIITGFRVAIDHNKLGFTMFKVFLYFDNLTKEDKSKLVHFCRGKSNIIYLVEQLSSWDYEIEFIVESYQEFIDTMNELRFLFKNSLRNYESIIMREDMWSFGDKKFL